MLVTSCTVPPYEEGPMSTQSTVSTVILAALTAVSCATPPPNATDAKASALTRAHLQ